MLYIPQGLQPMGNVNSTKTKDKIRLRYTSKFSHCYSRVLDILGKVANSALLILTRIELFNQIEIYPWMQSLIVYSTWFLVDELENLKYESDNYLLISLCD